MEYEHGGSKPVKKWSIVSGHNVTCSVDRAGDVAITVSSSSPGNYNGEVEVFAKGGSKGDLYSDSGACYYLWPSGYDNKNNLIVEGDHGAISICAVLDGAPAMTQLWYGEPIKFPGGVTWDGKYVALTDQQANGAYETGIEQATLSGSSLSYVGETVLTDTCDHGDTDVGAPFIVGKKNPPVNNEQGTVVVGVNSDCSAAGVEFWHYPQGGNRFRTIGAGSSFSGVVVSIGT